jgi:hypothetical protein
MSALRYSDYDGTPAESQNAMGHGKLGNCPGHFKIGSGMPDPYLAALLRTGEACLTFPRPLTFAEATE